MKIIKNSIKYSLKFLTGAVFALGFLLGGATNTTAQVWVNDIQVLKVAKSGEFASTNSTTEYVNSGDSVSVQVYYRAGANVSDAIVRITDNGGTNSSHTIIGGVYSAPGNSAGQVTITSSTPFTLTPVSAMWFRNDGMGNRSQVDITGNLNQIVNSGYSLGAINQNLNTQGAIVVKYQVVGQTVNPQPTIYQCNDGIDNDGDGLRDSQDPDCHSSKNICNYSYVQTYSENTYNSTPMCGPVPTTSAPSVITYPATSIFENSARLNSIASANGSDSATWYEWGATVNMNSRTASQPIGLGNNVTVSDSLSGLNPGTLYFYRGMIRNAQGVVRSGGVETFKTGGTAVVVTPTVRTVVRTVYRNVPAQPTTPQVNLVANNLVPGLVALRVTDTTTNNFNNVNACVGDEFNYEIVYQNVSGKTLTNSVLEVKIPTELDYVKSTNGGTYSNNNRSLVYNLGTLNPNQGGTLNVTVKASNLARNKGSVVTSLSLSYTNPDTLAQEEAIAYVIHNFGDCINNNGALAFFGTTFLPTTLAGWLLLIILILALVLLARTVYERTRKTGIKTTYQTTQETRV